MCHHNPCTFVGFGNGFPSSRLRIVSKYKGVLSRQLTKMNLKARDWIPPEARACFGCGNLLLLFGYLLLYNVEHRFNFNFNFDLDYSFNLLWHDGWKPEESIARQRRSKHVSTENKTCSRVNNTQAIARHISRLTRHSTFDKFLEAAFSMRSVQGLYDDTSRVNI
jgi:hypothetical protein